MPVSYLPCFLDGIVRCPHVIGVGDPLEDIEAMVIGQVSGTVSQMPFAETPGRITGIPEHFSHGVFVRMQSLSP